MAARIEGLQNVLQNIAMIGPIETAKMNNRIIVAGNILESAVKDHASNTDHTLKELADMGHPYSNRYTADSGPHPDDIVHSQSGTLLANIEKNQNLNTVRASVEVGVSKSNVPYIGYLINGTSKQRPRNFIGAAFREHLDEFIAITQGR